MAGKGSSFWRRWQHVWRKQSRSSSARGVGRLRPRLQPLEHRLLLSIDAIEDTLEAVEDTPAFFSANNVLANDTGAQAIVSVTQPAHGTLTTNADLTGFVYRADPNYNGPDSFTYTARSAPTVVRPPVGHILDIGLGEGDIELLGYSWFLINPVQGGSGGPGMATPGEFSFNAFSGAASPGLLAAVASSRPIDQVQVTTRRPADQPGGVPEKLVVWTLHGVTFTSLHVDAGDAAPQMFNATFDAIDVSFHSLDRTAFTSGWNFEKGQSRSAGGAFPLEKPDDDSEG
ncbi:MAG TPA: Ig-like domain-containing protein, partial [Castellaniella sp.]|nr:Ig-like domain-containing protein [Castellaniella sp.]